MDETPNATPVAADDEAGETTYDRGIDLAALARLGKPLSVRARALILDNFKSFPIKTRIPIRDGFTTVSGPNGSGKSNLIDALQFVLAVSTSKTLRAERLTDLISDLGKKPKARVALELECVFEDGGQPVGHVIEVARSVRRRASGADVRYELNSNPMRLSDLHDVLRHLGFPLSGQNFVLQNDVIRLTDMGAVARRQVLDELAGTKEFDRRITLAHEELKASDRLTEDTKLILTELGQRLEQLKKERDQALAYQELTERKQGLEEDLVVLEVTEAEVKVVQKADEIAAGEKARKAEERTREQLGAEAKRAGTELAALEVELASKGEGERMDALRAVESLRARTEGSREKAREAKVEAEARQKRRPKLAHDVDAAEGALREAQGTADDVAQELEEKQAKLAGLAQRFEAAGASLQREGKDRFEKADRIRAMRQATEALRTEEAQLVARDRELAERLSRGEAERGLISGTVQEASGRREEVHAQAAEAARIYRERRESFALLEERRRRLLQQVSSFRSGLDAVSAKASRAQSDLAAARAVQEQAHTMGGGRALAALRKADVGGVHGPVANLVEFEPRFAEALEAAAGSRLNYVVVDDEHVASRAIALLKRTGAGRLSFAPLNKVRGGRQPGQHPRGRGIVGFALDLVEAERTYERILQTVFGDTLVVETLDDAKPLIGQYRMVTLDGDIIERNAIMSGGSKDRRGGMLAAAAQAGELVAQRERAVDELEKQRQAAQDALRVAEGELEDVSQRVVRERASLSESETTSASLARELTRLEEGLGPQGDRLARLEQEHARLTAELAELAPRLETVRARLRDVSDEVQALDEPGGSQAFQELQRQAAEVEAIMRPLEKEVDRLRTEQAQAHTRRSVAEARLETARKALADADHEDQAATARLAELEASVAALSAELAETEGALQALSSELAELTRRRNEAREAYDRARDRAREAARGVELLDQRLAALASEKTELEARVRDRRAAAAEREVELPSAEDAVAEAPADIERERRRLQKTLTQADKELEALGPVNHLAIEQYDGSVSRHSELEQKIDVLELEKTQIRERIVDLEGKKRLAFLESFEKVQAAFGEAYAELGRGEGHLSLEDPKDPFNGGLLIKVRPRGKKLSRMEVMSGGEKALTALALIFALQEVNPAPLFVFDEVDKDLDGVNTKILAEAIRARADERQYMVISHHRVLLERSSQTLGVTMRKGFGTVVTGVEMDLPVDPAVADGAAVGASA